MIDLTTQKVELRDGVPIEKGVVLTKEFLDANQELFTNYLNYWLLYPDLFLDAIQPKDDAKNFHLFFYQRIALRASMRYRYHYWTATRATSKSFTAYLSSVVRAVLLPGSNIFISSDVKGTVIKIAEAKFNEIWRHWPLLKNELQTEEEDYNEVLLPQMNVARREVDGTLNPEEPTSAQIFITTAREKTVFMYGKLIECAVNAILRPNEYFVWGLSYEVPLHYGLLDKATLMDQRYSNTMSEDSFARESLSIWSGNSADAWLDSRKLNKHRSLLKCELEAKVSPNNPDAWYLIGCDVGRYKANTAVMVIKVLPGDQRFKKNIVYTEVINGANYITE